MGALLTATRHLNPHTSGHLVEPDGRAAYARLGPTVGPPWSLGRKTLIFFKVVPRPLVMLKQVVLGRLETRGDAFWAMENPKMP